MAFHGQISQEKIIETIGVSSSTWHSNKKTSKTVDKRKNNKGRSPTLVSAKGDGAIIDNIEICNILKNYRNDPFFQNGGGYKKLTHYLRREHGVVINKKKVYRLCKEEHPTSEKDQDRAKKDAD